jgi:ABC-type multidrug transport system ATPase subunit
VTALLEAHTPRVEGSDLSLGELAAEGPLLVLAGAWSVVFDLLAGERRLEGGSLRVMGENAEALARAGKIGLLRADAALPPTWTCAEVLRESARMLGLPKRTAVEQATQVALALGLGELLGKKLSALGPGQRRAIGVAAAALGQPLALALEEPFGALEPSEQRFVSEILRRAQPLYPLILSVAELTGSAEQGDFIAGATEILLLGRHGLAARGRHSELLGRAASYRLALREPAAPLLSRLLDAGYEARAVLGNETALVVVDAKGEGTEPFFAAALAAGVPIVELSPLGSARALGGADSGATEEH